LQWPHPSNTQQGQIRDEPHQGQIIKIIWEIRTGGIELDQDVLVVVDDQVLESIAYEDGDGAIVGRGSLIRLSRCEQGTVSRVKQAAERSQQSSICNVEGLNTLKLGAMVPSSTPSTKFLRASSVMGVCSSRRNVFSR
jgi:hypothetical protein